LRAIAAVQNHRNYFCPDVASVMAGLALGHAASAKSAATLGARERQVLQLVAEGHTSAEIAGRLHIAASTVDVHRRNIMRKLELHSVAELTRYAIQNGLAPG
jgi:two-component system NarL family response regulator